MKNLVLLVEGEGDVEAVPVLVKRIISERKGWNAIRLDKNPPFQVGDVNKLVRYQFRNWKRFLQAAMKRKNAGACLLLLDGDIKKVGGSDFCPATVAKQLAEEARSVGGGTKFSVTVIFACQEYESWLLAGLSSLAGKTLNDGQPGISSNAQTPDDDLEKTFRDAKGVLGRHMTNGYRPTFHQKALTEIVDLDVIRRRQLRSFQRLDSAITELIEAGRDGRYIVSPLPT